jgi:hypothetical protein
MMWTHELNKLSVRLDLSKVNKNFKRVEDNGYTLIIPKKNLWDWEEDEKFLRSVVVDKDGYVVSCSWPKFGNYGEFSKDTNILRDALNNNEEVMFSQKEDGSLCIRSVIDGKVVMRTRGTLYGGKRGEDDEPSYGERFFKVASDKYPKLLDPNWMSDRSLLFEYVSPSNLVVVKYKEEDLIFIGFVDHGLHIGHWFELKSIAQEAKLNLVKLHTLPRNVNELLEEVKTWKSEGVVVRCDQNQVLVKVKSAHYLAQHRMRFSVNYKFMVEFIELSGVKSEDELVEELKACGYDFEIVETCLPFYHRYQKVEDIFKAQLKDAHDILEEHNNTYKDMELEPFAHRKYLAISIKLGALSACGVLANSLSAGAEVEASMLLKDMGYSQYIPTLNVFVFSILKRAGVPYKVFWRSEGDDNSVVEEYHIDGINIYFINHTSTEFIEGPFAKSSKELYAATSTIVNNFFGKYIVLDTKKDEGGWSRELCLESMAKNDEAYVSPFNEDKLVMDIKKFFDKGYNRSMLFYGPPGSGKTTLAIRLTEHLNGNILILNGWSLANRTTGSIFDAINVVNPLVILFDDLDRISQMETLLGDLERLNREIFDKKRLFIATVNSIEKIPSALRRPGRFDHAIEFNAHNDVNVRKEILKIHANSIGVSLGDKLDHLAEITDEMTGAYLKEVVKRIDVLGMEDIDQHIEHMKEVARAGDDEEEEFL